MYSGGQRNVAVYRRAVVSVQKWFMFALLDGRVAGRNVIRELWRKTGPASDELGYSRCLLWEHFVLIFRLRC